MKIIDLLNKIANGEETPTHVKYINYIKNKEDIMLVCKENIIYKLDQLEIHLNDEVEILEEEKKIPKKLDKYADISGDLAYDWSFSEKKLKNKINEIIDYLEREED